MTQINKSAPLFFQRRFFPMWTALSLGAFTDNMLKQSLSIALAYGVIVVPFIANDDAIPIVGSFFPISMLLFSTIAGQMADKFETSLMFRRTKFIEFLLMVLAAVGFITGWSLLAILALFLMGAQSAFFSPVRTGAMPKYLQTDELVRGNALCSGGTVRFRYDWHHAWRVAYPASKRTDDCVVNSSHCVFHWVAGHPHGADSSAQCAGSCD